MVRKKSKTEQHAEPKPEPKVKAKRDAKASVKARKALFMAALRDTCNVSRSARQAGLSTSLLYRHRKTMPAFAAEWDAAIAEALDGVEEAILARVRDGVEKPVYYGGAQIGSVRQYSDRLAMFLLSSRRPEIYGRASADAAPLLHSDMSEADAEAEFMRRMERLKGE